jgi:hypothetical protein
MDGKQNIQHIHPFLGFWGELLDVFQQLSHAIVRKLFLREQIFFVFWFLIVQKRSNDFENSPCCGNEMNGEIAFY